MSFLGSLYSRVKNTVENSKKSFEEEKIKCQQESENTLHSVDQPLWVGAFRDEALNEQLKQELLLFSEDFNNFLKPSGQGMSEIVDFEGCMERAFATLQADPNLAHVRMILVPRKLKENAFWLAYFCQYELLKQKIGLSVPESEPLLSSSEAAQSEPSNPSQQSQDLKDLFEPLSDEESNEHSQLEADVLKDGEKWEGTEDSDSWREELEKELEDLGE
eukprot:GCRY01003639.1.p1 GENE.GCRY01003639.1~~GCRY01003639.1.p1  ORF type:complete len:218 (-),score=30.88 GCRY01003639.1:143-796(-)